MKRQLETGHIEKDSVQIYLCYETAYKKELKLVTAIESMHYREIGKRVWIKEAELKTAVRDNAFALLLEQPTLQPLVERDPDFIKKSEAIKADFALKQTKLDDQLMPDSDDEQEGEPVVISSNDYTEQSNKLKKDREVALQRLLVEWTKARLN